MIKVLSSQTELIEQKKWQVMCSADDSAGAVAMTTDECQVRLQHFSLFTCVQTPLPGSTGKKWLQVRWEVRTIDRDSIMNTKSSAQFLSGRKKINNLFTSRSLIHCSLHTSLYCLKRKRRKKKLIELRRLNLGKQKSRKRAKVIQPDSDFKK